MPFNPTTGVFARIVNTFSHPVVGTVIAPDDANSLFNDWDEGLTETNKVVLSTQPLGRATLASGTPVTTSNIVGATSVYYTPTIGNQVPIYNGTKMIPTVFAELTVPLDSNPAHTGYQQANKNFDLFVVNNAGVTTACTGPAWSTDISRGTGAGTAELQAVAGIWTNKNSMTVRFGTGSGDILVIAPNMATLVASFRTTANGITEDSTAKRFVSDLYNPQTRPMLAVDTTDSWTYSTNLFRQARASTLNQVEYIHALAGRAISVSVTGMALNSTSTRQAAAVGVGIDSTTTDFSTRRIYAAPDNLETRPLFSFYKGYPGIGYHKVVWLEKGAGADTQTFFGDIGLPALLQSGIDAETFN